MQIVRMCDVILVFRMNVDSRVITIHGPRAFYPTFSPVPPRVLYMPTLLSVLPPSAIDRFALGLLFHK